MSVIISKKLSRDKQKTWYDLEWGKLSGQRISANIFTYVKPANQIQKNHNKEALAILESKRSQLILDSQSINSNYITRHKFKANFLDYYTDFVKSAKFSNNRHLPCSLRSFRKFIGRDYISPNDITESLCFQFRDYLLKTLNGESPSNYFMRFKKVLNAAKRDGYFRNSPAEQVSAKANSNRKPKEILSVAEYQLLMNAPCMNYEVKKAFIFSLYSGLRFVDVKALSWEDIHEDTIKMLQRKTQKSLELPLHPIAKQLIGQRKTGLVFSLPTSNGSNLVLKQWSKTAGIVKHITWHCARHSFSVLLQQAGTNIATIAGMLGHTTTKYVHKTYQRYVSSEAQQAILKLPRELATF